MIRIARVPAFAKHSSFAASLRKNNFLRFLTYVAPYKKQLVFVTIGGIAKFSLPLLVPQVTRYLLDNVYLNTSLSTEARLQQLAFYVGGMILLFIFVYTPLVYVRHFYSGKVSQQAMFDLRCQLYYRILRMSASFFDRNKSGAIVSRLINDIEIAQNLIGSALTDIWMDLISLSLILFFLIQIDPALTVAALITFPFYIRTFRKSQTQVKDSSKRIQEELAHMSGTVQEKIAGSRVIHAFAQEQAEQDSFTEESAKLLSMNMIRVSLQSTNITTSVLITNIAPLIVALYGGYRVITGTLTIGDLVAAGMYLAPLYLPLERFAQLNLVFANSMAAVERVFEIMDAEPEIKDRPNALKLDNVVGRVEFDDVHFAYENVSEPGPILRNISFTVEPGQKVALVGPSGSGKSTLVSLMMRFYDVQAGTVRIDGHDVRDLTVNSLRSSVGMVLQNPILFSGTVAENIRYGRPDASDAEVIEAAKAANAYDFIMKLPKGFNSELGENGLGLSGGQRQRLTIARAFLKDPRILVLDEATSALDNESERLIQNALEKLMIGRTTFIIAHRLTTIQQADRIIVLEAGCLVESGTHDELLCHADGCYRRLYSQQVVGA
jgi:subfamily B ATP-binding cassette protein MsbA